MHFSSDTASEIHPKILEAMADANSGPAASYGADIWTQKAEARLSDWLEAPLKLSMVASGTASNALALSLLCPPIGGIICHKQAHINCDERGAPEFFSHGAKLMPLDGAHGKLSPDDLSVVLQTVDEKFVHAVPPKAVSISNLTESGTAYTPREIATLSEMAKKKGLGFHVDGARFCNALAFSGSRPADMSWGAGVDILSLGMTKNGAMSAECVVLFKDQIEQFAQLEARRKRAGHMPPKQRFAAAQILAMLENDLWLELAQNANQMAQDLGEGLQNCGAQILHPIEGNEVFAKLNPTQLQKCKNAGVGFYDWPDGSCRFVTSWNTTLNEVKTALGILG